MKKRISLKTHLINTIFFNCFEGSEEKISLKKISELIFDQCKDLFNILGYQDKGKFHSNYQIELEGIAKEFKDGKEYKLKLKKGQIRLKWDLITGNQQIDLLSGYNKITEKYNQLIQQENELKDTELNRFHFLLLYKYLETNFVENEENILKIKDICGELFKNLDEILKKNHANHLESSFSKFIKIILKNEDSVFPYQVSFF